MVAEDPKAARRHALLKAHGHDVALSAADQRSRIGENLVVSTPPALPLYYPGRSLADMEQLLRTDYLRKSGWLESAEAKLSIRGGAPIPWFTYGAIAFLERELTADLAMFEYGGGQSSRYWAGRLKRLVSVDHDPAFAALIRPTLPAHADFRLVTEGAELSGRLAVVAGRMPSFTDPERTERTYRSGQLNLAFRCYGLQILEHPPNSFDVVVIDGMARVLSTWAAIQHFRGNGFIVFDNSDRDFYRDAYAMLGDAGYRRIDFRGLGPVNPYEWCTSVFYEHKSFTAVRWFDAEARPAGSAPAVAPEDRLGILVLAYNRPWHLQSVLESLRQQNQLGVTHVWVDGTQGRAELADASDETVAVARRYAVRELRAHRSHLGIEKMMLDALRDMSRRYSRVLVIEDDCFPLEGAIEDFEEGLRETADQPDIYSVYGHHFGFELEDSLDFTRFQGWGWAAHSDRIRALLPDLRVLFDLDEESYRARIAAAMTADIRRRLDVTPGRNVLAVLDKFFSWDSATAFLTAQRGMRHRRTGRPAVVNTGIQAGIGHFTRDTPWLRGPPYNMIRLEEAWMRYDRTTRPCDGSRPSYGLDALDLSLLAALDGVPPGFFVEIGAYDGVTQSNSVLLEKRGWKGLLIEASPAAYARCVKARPNAIVEHAACVAADHAEARVLLTDVGLMTLTDRSSLDQEAREGWLSRGEGFAKRPRQTISVPATTLSALLDKHGIACPDLLLLDVEGAEVDVLRGLDMPRHAPRLILAEDAYTDEVAAYLSDRGYIRRTILLERKFTRDVLYVRA